MPGLVALLAPKYNRPVAASIADMTEAMDYENFYVKEIFDKEHCPFVASRVHLNILNREPQPIYNENRSLLIMMDGELHTRDSIKEQLRTGGHSIKTDSDAELLLHLYEQKGEDFVHDLNGWFLALIYDIKQAKSMIVNDCFGICRAFYTQHEDTFIISSEIKSILKYRQMSFTPNKDKFAQYFLYDSILNDKTLFKEIRRLPAASIWTYKDGAVSKKQYFDFSAVHKNTAMSKQEFDEEASRVFKKVLPRYIYGSGVGLSLTGGWDTRAELAVISNLGYSIPCYTWCGPYRDSLDVKVAREVAKIAGMEHRVFYIGKDFLDDFSHYANRTVFVSDGSTDIFRSHEIYLNKLTRTLSPIRLTGKFGSQTMSRAFFLHAPTVEKRIFSEQFLNDAGDLSRYIYSFESRESMVEVMRWLWPDGYTAVERSQVLSRTPYLDKDLTILLFSAPDDYLCGSSVQKFMIKRNCPPLADVPSNKGKYIRSDSAFKNIKLRTLSFIFSSLTKLDKAYLHQAVPDIFVRMDPLMKSARLERLFLGACHLGAYRRWIKAELKDFIKKVLLEEQTLSRPYLNADFVKKLTSDHFHNRANYVREIGKIISLELWHRLFIDGEAVS